MAILVKAPSLDEFLKLPEEKPALQYEDGRITQKVSPKGQHSQLQSDLVELILQFARPRKLARAYAELRATYGGRSTVPDLSVYRWSRLPIQADGKIANDFVDPPDVAIEIVSPDQSATTLVRRCLWYVSNGVAIALLIDPEDESVLRFRPNQAPMSLTGPDRIDLDDVLPGFALTVQQVFDLMQVE